MYWDVRGISEYSIAANNKKGDERYSIPLKTYALQVIIGIFKEFLIGIFD